ILYAKQQIVVNSLFLYVNLARTRSFKVNVRKSGVDLFLGDANQLREGVCIIDRQISQHLAVDFHTSKFEAMHQLAVGKAVEASCRVDAHDPKIAEVTLSLTAVTICIRE